MLVSYLIFRLSLLFNYCFLNIFYIFYSSIINFRAQKSQISPIQERVAFIFRHHVAMQRDTIYANEGDATE